jgi:hypothetical protein
MVTILIIKRPSEPVINSPKQRINTKDLRLIEFSLIERYKSRVYIIVRINVF